MHFEFFYNLNVKVRGAVPAAKPRLDRRVSRLSHWNVRNLA